jgi:hypothetical protein
MVGNSTTILLNGRTDIFIQNGFNFFNRFGLFFSRCGLFFVYFDNKLTGFEVFFNILLQCALNFEPLYIFLLVTVIKLLAKKTRSTNGNENNSLASGEIPVLSASGKSKLMASGTSISFTTNFNELGFGFDSR